MNSGSAQSLWIHISTSLWFLPSTIVLFSIALALGLMELDMRFGKELSQAYPRFFSHEPDGANTMLGTIASSMATIVGVVFSIVIVALVLASTQYTSRILRNFMSDPITQTMLGTLTGIFTYSLLILRGMSSDQDSFVPALSVLGGFLLALIGIALFIMFIHHIASSIQASSIVAEITKETIQSIKDTYPMQCHPPEELDQLSGLKDVSGFERYPIQANKTGNIQSAKPEGLVKFAVEHGVIIQMKCCVGNFVDAKTELVLVYSQKPVTEDMITHVQDFFAIDSFRTVIQDPSYGIRQLVDIALKALSPGINDTTTAVTCIEHLAVILSSCTNRCIPAPNRYQDEQLRLISCGPDFRSMVELAFIQILESAKGSSEIYINLLTALHKISKCVETGDHMQAIKHLQGMIQEDIGLHVRNQSIRARIETATPTLL